ncbi:MAG: alpha/beta hydrolase [Micrococcus sp.]|nr:alpha/beta hydrolase [Micrococcus sp.]
MEAEELSSAQVARRDIWDPVERRATRERLRADMRRRHVLGPRQKAALDGLVHALRPQAMDRSFPERILLAYDLGTALHPAAGVIAVGEPATATHLTWQVSGMGVFVHTAMWGSVREAGQLWAAQRAAGAENPCVVCWLGYQPPGPWGVLSGRQALRGGARLALHMAGWFDYRERLAASGEDAGEEASVGEGERSGAAPGEGPGATGPDPFPHTAVEAHSYGTLVAARALQMLQRRNPPRSVDALVMSGAVGVPRDLAGNPHLLGLTSDQVYFALTGSDYLSWLGRRLSGRRPWTKMTRLKIAADEALDLAAAVGHNTSRFRPDAGPFHRGHGYRDAGTASLYRIARATTGLPLD